MTKGVKFTLIGLLIIFLIASGIEIFFNIYNRISQKIDEEKKYRYVAADTSNTSQNTPNNSQTGSESSNISGNEEPARVITREEVVRTNNYVEYNEISDCLNTYFELLNAKKYEEAYNMLDIGFQKKYYPTLEKFIQFVANIYDSGKSPSVNSFVRIDNRYYCTVRIVNAIINGDDPTNLIQLENFTLYKNDNAKMKLAFGGFVYAKDLNNISAVLGNIKFSIIGMEKNIYSVKYYLKVDNNQPDLFRLLDATKANVFLEYKTKKGTDRVNLTNNSLTYQDFTIQPNSSKTYMLEFDNYTEQPLILHITNIPVNGERQKLALKLN